MCNKKVYKKLQKSSKIVKKKHEKMVGFTEKSIKSNIFFGKRSHLRKTCKTVWKITDLITFFDKFLTKKITKILYFLQTCG